MAWLEDNKLISVQRRPGRDPVVTLLQEDGSGAPYEIPGRAAQDPSGRLPINHYLKVPAGFWRQGWAAYLDAPAIAMLLVLLAKAQNRRASGVWISPSQLRDWYGFSDDTRRRGVTALENAGLICVSRVPVDPDFERRRVRNSYSIEPDLLDRPIDTQAKTRWSPAVELGLPRVAAWANYVNERLAGADD